METKIKKILNKTRNGRSLTKTEKIYTHILNQIEKINFPHKFMKEGYNSYKRYVEECETKSKNNSSLNSMNGKIFELLICETLLRKGITPFYYQAEFKLVPDIKFDIVCYNYLNPVALSIKTSLRERYKQASLEGLVLRQVYRHAETYLLTMEGSERKNTQKKIENKKVAGLIACIAADEEDYDRLLDNLKDKEFTEADLFCPLKGGLIQAI